MDMDLLQQALSIFITSILFRGTPFGNQRIHLPKEINDKWGHMVGDRAIKHVADLLSDNIRSSDYLFRYGGEEFLLVLVETRAAEAFPLLERLRKKIGQLAFNVGGDTQIPITASIGFAAHTGHPDYNLLLRDADNALYAAKREGRNCVKMHKGGG